MLEAIAQTFFLSVSPKIPERYWRKFERCVSLLKQSSNFEHQFSKNLGIASGILSCMTLLAVQLVTTAQYDPL
jgi:hypothetical protein